MYYTKYSNDKINLNEAFGKGRVLKMKMNYKKSYFRPVKYSPFFTCKKFCPVLNSLRQFCLKGMIWDFDFTQS